MANQIFENIFVTMTKYFIKINSMSKIDVKSLLESLKVQPNDYRPIDDQEDDSSKYSLGNGATDIYLVKDKYNKVFIKKEFKIDSTYEANNSSSNSSIDSTGVINSVDDDDDSDKFDFGSYQSSDSDISPTNTIKYFQREVENLIKVQIKGLPFLNIIGYNFQVGENQPFIITKQMKGDTLKHLIDTNFEKCSNKSTIQMIIFYGVVFALKYLHKIKVIHRDIKPANIFLNEKYEPFLGDFGFARVIQESTKLTENIGTTFYMAEELINNDSELKPSEKIDSYSFAVTVLETLTLDLTIQNTDGKILSKNKKDCECLDENTFRTLTSKGKKYIIPYAF